MSSVRLTGDVRTNSAETTASVRRLRTAGDLEDDHDAGRVIDEIDHAQVADPEAPELGIDQLPRARRMRI